MNKNKEKLKVLITVKTYPNPSKKYNEVVCTAGVRESGDFIRLYPINFRDLPYNSKFKKYQWIEVLAEKHMGQDRRKESYRPDTISIKMLGEPIPTDHGDWSDRGKIVLQKVSQSIEELKVRYRENRTSLGIIKPKVIKDLVVVDDEREWKPSAKARMQQYHLWETSTSKEPPRKLPFKFRYIYESEDTHCTGHEQAIIDWEVGRLFWRLRDMGATEKEAKDKIKYKFLNQLCASDKDTHFYVGNLLQYPKSWLVLGVYYPRLLNSRKTQHPTLFDMN
jgi:hypothetical protein